MLPPFAHVQSLDVLLQVPFAAELFVAKLALDLLLDAALVVHVPQHDAAGRVPLAALEAGKILSVFARQQPGLVELARGIAATVQIVRQRTKVVVITPQL